MKLRNKKTGEVVNGSIILKTDYHSHPWNCDSIAEIVEHWEDYKEPLIKDEKIRKAVRAWAEANAINSGHYYNTDIKFNVTDNRLQWIQTAIDFNDITGLDNLEDGETYTIAELCGEEEE